MVNLFKFASIIFQKVLHQETKIKKTIACTVEIRENMKDTQKMYINFF